MQSQDMNTSMIYIIFDASTNNTNSRSISQLFTVSRITMITAPVWV
jgi:hypothetical protein